MQSLPPIEDPVASPPPDEDAELSLLQLRLALWATLFFSMALFAKLPGLDLLVSARYFVPEQGFVHARDPWVLALYDWTPWLGRALFVAVLVVAVLAPLWSRHLQSRGHPEAAQRWRGTHRRVAVLFVCAALLGPGVLIEGVFKNTMGRPRPVQVEPFGGPQAYLGPFVRGSNPEAHRSFTSSHAATGFALMGFGLGCGAVWRRRWLLIGLVCGGLVGLGRILQGGHYLSDVVFSFFAVWLCCELVAWADARMRRGHSPPTARPHRPTI